jgi:hypothetical protein
VALGAFYEPKGMSATVAVRDLTSHPDIVGRPVTFEGQGAAGAVGFNLDGTVDTRSSATESVKVQLDLGGFSLGIPASQVRGVALPSAQGVLRTDTTFTVARDHTVRVGTTATLDQARVESAPFEPAFVYDIYAGVLSDIHSLDLTLGALIANGNFALNVDTDVDTQIASALQKQLGVQVERFKAEVRARAASYLRDVSAQYAGEIASFRKIADTVGPIAADLQNLDTVIDRKKAEVEARLKDAATQKVDEAKQQAVNKATDAATNALKKLF